MKRHTTQHFVTHAPGIYVYCRKLHNHARQQQDAHALVTMKIRSVNILHHIVFISGQCIDVILLAAAVHEHVIIACNVFIGQVVNKLRSGNVQGVLYIM